MSSTLTLTVAGRDYTVASPPMRVGVAIQAYQAIALARSKGEPAPEKALARVASLYGDPSSSIEEDALGDAYEQMLADDVPLEDYKRAVQAVIRWIATGDEEQARAVMAGEGGGSGPKASTTTGEDATTPTPASMSGTTSRRKKSQGSRGK